jgi:uncharacterized UBP type Zn finger protein
MRLFGAKARACTHEPTAVAQPRADSCEGCGSDFNLRLCTECGYVGCCESQRAHDRSRARETGHQMIKSFPLTDGSFTWCYACGRYL